MKKALLICLALVSFGMAEENLSLDVISYELFAQNDPATLQTLKTALYEKGIVGMRGVPGYQEKYARFIEAARAFSKLPEEVKETYAPDRSAGSLFNGYEKGKEKFKRPDGRWIVDDKKVSYYATVPPHPRHKWPSEVDLELPYLDLTSLMSETGKTVLEKIELTGPATGIFLENSPQLGRMVFYQNSTDPDLDNPLWCSAHFDHSLFTALTPASYFVEDEEIPEPEEAGLFVKVKDVFQKVVADPEVLMFQVGEFGQLATNDAVRATEHSVHKAAGSVVRYAMAVFFIPPMDALLHSTSVLTQDARYGGKAGDPCTYEKWNEGSFNRYLVKD